MPDDKKSLSAGIQTILDLANVGEIEGVIIFSAHKGNRVCFSIDGLDAFDVPVLSVMVKEILRRLEEGWFNNQVDFTKAIRPNLEICKDE